MCSKRLKLEHHYHPLHYRTQLSIVNPQDWLEGSEVPSDNMLEDQRLAVGCSDQFG